MKHLKTYKIWESYNRFGTKTITESEFSEIKAESCKNFSKIETELFRGMPDLGDYVFVDPRSGDFRSSIEDTNIHLELMSNLPSWKDYPRYDRCVIGGTRGSATGTYGQAVYQMIPFDGVKIGICPESTVWQSFGNRSLGDWGGYIYLVEHFLDAIGLETGWIQIEGETLEDKLESLGKISEISSRDFEAVDSFLSECSDTLSLRTGEITGRDCFRFINDWIFNPEKRGFKLQIFNRGFFAERGKQVWTEGPVLLTKNF